MILKLLSVSVELDYQILPFLIDVTKSFDRIDMTDRFLVKGYWLVIVVDYEDEDENFANVIDSINKFESPFYEQFWIFQKCADFAHDSLIKTLNAPVHLEFSTVESFTMMSRSSR